MKKRKTAMRDLWRCRQRMRIWREILCLSLSVSLILTGCGGNATPGGIRAGKNRAASQGAVSGAVVAEENEPYCYCTDTNLYLTTEDGIVQCRLDGTHKKRIITAQYDVADIVEYADSDSGWLYYTEQDGDLKAVLYRVPIEKDSDGYDVVKMSERKELMRDFVCNRYSDSEYFIYTTDEGTLVKFDLKKEQKVSEVKYVIRDDVSDSYIFRGEDCYVYKEEDISLAYIQGVDDTEWQSFKCPAGELYVQMQRAGKHGAGDVYYSVVPPGEGYGRAVNRIDTRQRESVSFVTEDELKNGIIKALQTDKGKDETKETLEYFRIVDLFTQGERIYLMAEAGWEKDGVFYMENLIFGKGREDSELRYEQGLNECMHAHNTKRTGKWVDSQYWKKVFREKVVYDDAGCVQMVDGKAYLFCYDYAEDKIRLGCYELASGRFWWIKKGDADYMALFYDYPFWEDSFEYIFDTISEGNDFAGLTGRPPEDKESLGVFWEEG